MPLKRRVPEALRRETRERALGRCEYCLIHEDDAFYPHEADHIIAEKHGGATTLENLAWACSACNRFKGTDIASVDPQTGRVVPLFHPRRQQWARHFQLNEAVIEPLTASGRVTVFLLHLNDRRRMIERETLVATGRYPSFKASGS